MRSVSLCLWKSLACAAAASLLLSGCGADEASEGGALALPNGGPAPADGPEVGSLNIAVLSARRVRLGFSEHSQIRVRVRDANGLPAPDVLVRFATIGRSQDAGLRAGEGWTDADGIVENELTTGTMAATFDVRVSTPGAVDELIAVAVSDAGFGTLLVQAPYVGPRTMTQRKVYALPNMDCEDAERMTGDPMTTLGPRESLAEFLVLPAGVRYAVLAEVEGQKETVVARGCEDGVLVEANI